MFTYPASFIFSISNSGAVTSTVTVFSVTFPATSVTFIVNVPSPSHSILNLSKYVPSSAFCASLVFTTSPASFNITVVNALLSFTFTFLAPCVFTYPASFIFSISTSGAVLSTVTVFSVTFPALSIATITYFPS